MHFSQSFRALASAAILSLAAVTASADSVTLSSSTVGNTDKTSAWWTAFSDGVTIPAGKTLTFKFTNHAGSGNFNNWVVVLSTSADRSASNYKEYFLLRADNFGWGTQYNAALYTNNYAEVATAANTEKWEYFRSQMEGAKVTMKIAHSSSGIVFVNVSAISTSGVELTANYYAPCSIDDVVAFLTVEDSYISGLTADIESEDVAVKNVTFANAEGVTHYFVPGATTTPFIKASVLATATLSDGTSVQLTPNCLTTSSTISKDGKYTASCGGFKYNGVANVSTASCTLIGKTDFSNSFGVASTEKIQVKKGETASQAFQVRSKDATAWYSPTALIASSSNVDAAFRTDKWAFQGTTTISTNAALFGTPSSDFFFEPLCGNYVDGAYFTVSLANKGDKLDLTLQAIDASGVSRSTTYTDIPATTFSPSDEDDIYLRVTTECAYFLIPSAESSALRQVADGVDVKVEGGNIEVSGAESFEVYDMNGRKVSSTGLTRGLYIVRTAGVAKKIIIK